MCLPSTDRGRDSALGCPVQISSSPDVCCTCPEIGLLLPFRHVIFQNFVNFQLRACENKIDVDCPSQPTRHAMPFGTQKQEAFTVRKASGAGPVGLGMCMSFILQFFDLFHLF
jgi:hypothetical protein